MLPVGRWIPLCRDALLGKSPFPGMNAISTVVSGLGTKRITAQGRERVKTGERDCESLQESLLRPECLYDYRLVFNDRISISHPTLTLFSMLLASSWVMPIKDSLFMAMS